MKANRADLQFSMKSQLHWEPGTAHVFKIFYVFRGEIWRRPEEKSTLNLAGLIPESFGTGPQHRIPTSSVL